MHGFLLCADWCACGCAIRMHGMHVHIHERARRTLVVAERSYGML